MNPFSIRSNVNLYEPERTPLTATHRKSKNISFKIAKTNEMDETEEYEEDKTNIKTFPKGNSSRNIPNLHNRNSNVYEIKKPYTKSTKHEEPTLAKSRNVRNLKAEKEEIKNRHFNTLSYDEENQVKNSRRVEKKEIEVIEVLEPPKHTINSKDKDNDYDKTKKEGFLKSRKNDSILLTTQSRKNFKSTKQLEFTKLNGSRESSKGVVFKQNKLQRNYSTNQLNRYNNDTSNLGSTSNMINISIHNNSNYCVTEDDYLKSSPERRMDIERSRALLFANSDHKKQIDVKNIDELYPWNKKVNSFNVDEMVILEEKGECLYGKIFSVKDQFDNEYSMLRYVSSNSFTTEELFNHIEKANSIPPNEFIARPLAVNITRLDKSSFCLSVLFKPFENDLDSHLTQLKKRNDLYSELELLMIIKSVALGLEHLQKFNASHGHIIPSSLLFSKNELEGTLNLIMLMPMVNDLLTSKFNLAFNSKFLKEYMKKNEYYVSPILYKCFTTNNFSAKHNPFKSDTYSLGVCILHAATLNQKVLFLSRARLDSDSMKKIIQTNMKGKYSSKFIDLLSSLLLADEKKRAPWSLIVEKSDSLINEIIKSEEEKY